MKFAFATLMRGRRMKLHQYRQSFHLAYAGRSNSQLTARLPRKMGATPTRHPTVVKSSRPLALRHHRCLAHLRQYTVEFASLHSCDDSLDCRDELFFLADRDRSFTRRKLDWLRTVTKGEDDGASRISSPPRMRLRAYAYSTKITRDEN